MNTYYSINAKFGANVTVVQVCHNYHDSELSPDEDGESCWCLQFLSFSQGPLEGRYDPKFNLYYNSSIRGSQRDYDGSVMHLFAEFRGLL